MCGNQVFSTFPNNSRSKQNKNNPKHPFVGIGKWETCAKFQRKILNSRVVGVRQRFQILKQNKLFLNIYATFISDIKHASHLNGKCSGKMVKAIFGADTQFCPFFPTILTL